MIFRSTAEQSPSVDFATALLTGVPPDGGLYHPESLPPFPSGFLEEIQVGIRRHGPDPVRTGTLVLNHLIGGEGGISLTALERVSREALTFPLPLTRISPSTFLLELFHGPTLAFKDVGARVMAHLLAALEAEHDGRIRTILTATSGDTGGAVASAFEHVPGTRVVVLFPRGRVSREQRIQFTTAGPNVHALAVDGSFDDCQRLAREAFADTALRRRHGLTSANSINVGRLLPQLIYYVHGWAQLPLDAPPPSYAVPSGNLGNLTAGLMARAMGLPAHDFIAATNANRVLVDFLDTGRFSPQPSRPTLSSAMDVGDPSNLRRILALYSAPGDNRPLLDPARLQDTRRHLSRHLSASSWSDEETEACIRRTKADTGRLVDPHTAVGMLALQAARGTNTGQSRPPGIILATAHPAKFRATVEPLIHDSLPLPASLEERLHEPERTRTLESTLPALVRALDDVGTK